MEIDYRAMAVGDRAAMPVPGTWEGANQALYHEVQAYCQGADPAPQFEVESVRESGKPITFWLKRTR